MFKLMSYNIDYQLTVLLNNAIRRYPLFAENLEYYINNEKELKKIGQMTFDVMLQNNYNLRDVHCYNIINTYGKKRIINFLYNYFLTKVA